MIILYNVAINKQACLNRLYARHKQDRDSKKVVRTSVVSFSLAFWLKIFKCSPCHKTDGNMIYLLHYRLAILLKNYHILTVAHSHPSHFGYGTGYMYPQSSLTLFLRSESRTIFSEFCREKNWDKNSTQGWICIQL